MDRFILKPIFSTILSIINITRLSNQEKDLEILILRQQLSILQRKHNSPIKLNRVEKITLAVLTARLKRITHRSANQLCVLFSTGMEFSQCLFAIARLDGVI